ncbi:DUF6622 family protein [Ramlibacter sp. PS4R-6]|uniref:DUF6622 family protein n=1 Tax=Ramlibacter sp. PS4R-6 TaxID=3133438 RepID=UPI0030A89006
MLIPMLIDHPQVIGPVLRGTPGWVWGLLAALVALGVTQLRDRQASLVRVSIMPVAMTGFAIWGLVGAFSAASAFGYMMIAWMLVAAVVFAGIAMTAAPKGTEYDAAQRTFFLPGSWVPLALILAVFLTRYVVNIDIAMQPSLKQDGSYMAVVAGIYGISTGLFVGRAARLWRLAAERSGFGFLLQRDPW